MPSAKVIPLAARVPTPWQAGSTSTQSQPGPGTGSGPTCRQTERQQPKLVVVVVDVAWNPLPTFRFRPLLWHAHAERTADRRTGRLARQAMRRIDVNPLLMTLPYHAHLFPPSTRIAFSDELCACACATFDWPCGFCLAAESVREGGCRPAKCKGREAGILQNSIFG